MTKMLTIRSFVFFCVIIPPDTEKTHTFFRIDFFWEPAILMMSNAAVLGKEKI